jgi:hypothetical protein
MAEERQKGDAPAGIFWKFEGTFAISGIMNH